MTDQPKFYDLMMFPYPSGSAMHVGHASNYLYSEIVARYKRMKGYDVVFPLGYDSFGLPTENFAIKNNKSAWQATEENVKYFDEQVEAMDFSLDKDRMFKTSDPEYYKWTQWVFSKLYEHDLVYRKDGLVNRCPSCQTVLANDQVVDGKCERCESEVIQKQMPQWYIKITDYAEQLLDYSDCDRPEETKTHQTNWIGKSEGMLFTAKVKDMDLTIQTFSAHFEACYADTFVSIAPDHHIVKELIKGLPNEDEVNNFCKYIIEQRKEAGHDGYKEIEGIFTGRYIEDPLGNGYLPIWVASFALADYGTGIVKCSAHDERDFQFAKKYNIPLKTVLLPYDEELKQKVINKVLCFSDMDNGYITEPKEFNGQKGKDIRNELIIYLESKGYAQKKTTYRLRDWSVSRQRYWGSPIPIYYTFEDNEDGRYTADNPHPDKSKWIPHLIPESQLPVILPLDLPNYKPAGKSPLEDHLSFKYYNAPDGQTYLRECDTLDTFMCSSFYYLRFLDPHNSDYLISDDICERYMPVDLYIGGKEHTVGHLLYSRFVYKFLKDKGYIVNDSKEPFYKLVHQGMIHAHDGRKMSKRRGNVIDPMDIIKEYGSDTLRTYIMFMGPVELNKNRNPDAVAGVKRFLDRVERAIDFVSDVDDKDVDSLTQQTIKGVTEDIDSLKFNTAISKIMILTNGVYDYKSVSRSNFESLLLLLSPFASRLTQKLRVELGNDGEISKQIWPVWDESKIASSSIDLPIQVNGKMRGIIEVSPDISEEEAIKLITSDDRFTKYITGDIKKVIWVPGKICNIII